MNYPDLFTNASLFDAGDNFRCFLYREGRELQLECPCRYPMLCVLQGSLEMHFQYKVCHIEAGKMFVIDTEHLTRYIPSAGTVVMAYLPPPQLALFFSHSSMAFHSAYSEIVPILPPLRSWIDVQLADYVRGVRCTDYAAYRQRRELLRIIHTYPSNKRGDFFAPFSFCSRNGCSRCKPGLPSQQQ